jgi:hypothetical protein
VDAFEVSMGVLNAIDELGQYSGKNTAKKTRQEASEKDRRTKSYRVG